MTFQKIVSLLQGFDGQPVEILQAENGEQSIDMARQHKPDLILMDIKMPVMDGVEATKIIKKDKDLKDIPVIALTATSIQDEDVQLKELLFDDYLTKPVKMRFLINIISKFLRP